MRERTALAIRQNTPTAMRRVPKAASMSNRSMSRKGGRSAANSPARKAFVEELPDGPSAGMPPDGKTSSA